MRVSKNAGTPKSSILIGGFHEINHPAIGGAPFMEPPKSEESPRQIGWVYASNTVNTLE